VALHASRCADVAKARNRAARILGPIGRASSLCERGDTGACQSPTQGALLAGSGLLSLATCLVRSCAIHVT
jgi:hypothetical protein